MFTSVWTTTTITNIYKLKQLNKHMRFKKKVIYSWIISSATWLVSILVPLIPCQKGANVPNPNYTWELCRLSPDLMKNTDLKTFFFGYTSSMTETYFIILIMTFLISFGLMHFLTRKKGKD
jgi:hypothetical protein